ncbi:MAG: hypothetical protein KGM97_02750, partial [Alphaproteobacteria bacterium]|nr:hypothetical protein [Alphaproteobacteria bacterium]
EQHHHAHHALSHAHIHGKRQDQPNAARIPGGKDGSRNRNALPLILGSSPMVEGIPAFFAAVKYGVGLIAIMAMVFAASTITTYVLICISSTAVLQRLRSGVLERHGEVLSGAAIAIVGLVFWLWPLAL